MFRHRLEAKKATSRNGNGVVGPGWRWVRITQQHQPPIGKHAEAISHNPKLGLVWKCSADRHSKRKTGGTKSGFPLPKEKERESCHEKDIGVSYLSSEANIYHFIIINSAHRIILILIRIV